MHPARYDPRILWRPDTLRVEFSEGPFTDGKPHRATAADLKAPWGGVPNAARFRCYLCGHRFVEGDYYRWQYTNNIPGAGGNPLVCEWCDGPDVIERWRLMHVQATERFWWFTWRDARAGLNHD